jgi:hypothetical protein
MYFDKLSQVVKIPNQNDEKFCRCRLFQTVAAVDTLVEVVFMDLYLFLYGATTCRATLENQQSING